MMTAARAEQQQALTDGSAEGATNAEAAPDSSTVVAAEAPTEVARDINVEEEADPYYSARDGAPNGPTEVVANTATEADAVGPMEVAGVNVDEEAVQFTATSRGDEVFVGHTEAAGADDTAASDVNLSLAMDGTAAEEIEIATRPEPPTEGSRDETPNAMGERCDVMTQEVAATRSTAAAAPPHLSQRASEPVTEEDVEQAVAPAVSAAPAALESQASSAAPTAPAAPASEAVQASVMSGLMQAMQHRSATQQQVPARVVPPQASSERLQPFTEAEKICMAYIWRWRRAHQLGAAPNAEHSSSSPS